jgi:hypothetical protein
MPEVFRVRNVYIVRVFVERGSCEPPHMHVVWPGKMARLTLPDLTPLAPSHPVPRFLREEIMERLEDIVNEWNRCNPTTPVSLT